MLHCVDRTTPTPRSRDVLAGFSRQPRQGWSWAPPFLCRDRCRPDLDAHCPHRGERARRGSVRSRGHAVGQDLHVVAVRERPTGRRLDAAVGEDAGEQYATDSGTREQRTELRVGERVTVVDGFTQARPGDDRRRDGAGSSASIQITPSSSGTARAVRRGFLHALFHRSASPDIVLLSSPA
jgi:hypothetical protein